MTVDLKTPVRLPLVACLVGAALLAVPLAGPVCADDARAPAKKARSAAPRSTGSTELGSIEAAERAFARGHVATALESLRRLARAGNALAAYRLGRLYRAGKGMAANPGRALNWFWRAARKRLSAAHIEIGLMYLAGDHVRRDIAEAWAHFRVAARLGNPRGRSLLSSIGVRMDALELWRARERSTELWPRPVEATRPAR